MALSEANNVSLCFFTENDCPGRHERDCCVDVNGGGNKPRLCKNFAVSARKEYSYMIYKVVCGIIY